MIPSAINCTSEFDGGQIMGARVYNERRSTNRLERFGIPHSKNASLTPADYGVRRPSPMQKVLPSPCLRVLGEAPPDHEIVENAQFRLERQRFPRCARTENSQDLRAEWSRVARSIAAPEQSQAPLAVPRRSGRPPRSMRRECRLDRYSPIHAGNAEDH